ncbi:hypothetical protein [Sphingobium yanoikuyae]|nr:hypothetical protein [Sphingobium yanoikuyae]
MLLARRYIIFGLAICGAIAGIVIAKTLPKTYEARSRVILKIVQADPVTGQAIPPRALETVVQAQLELIRDRRVTDAVVENFGWEKSPELRSAYSLRRGDKDLDFRAWLAKRVSDSTNAYLIPNSPILEIAYAATSPTTARRGADAVREAFIAQTLEMKRNEAARNAEWFQKQTDDLKRALAAAEARKSKFEQDNNIVLQDDNVDAESAKLKALASAAAVPMMPSISLGGAASSPSAAQLAAVDAQLTAARRTLGANHPDIIALQQQRAALASAASRELAAARAASRPAAGPSMEGLLTAQTRKVLAQRGLVGEAQRLGGDVAVLRDQVTKAAQRTADFQLQAQSTESGLDKMGAAVTPTTPVTIARPLFLVGGFFVGLGLGAAIALLLELIFRRIRGIEDLYIEGIPVIGEMRRDDKSTPNPGLLQWLGIKKMEQQPT